MAYRSYEAIISLAYRVPHRERWTLTREILQTPDYSAPPAEDVVHPLEKVKAAQHELSDVTLVLDEIITRLSQDPHGVSAGLLVRRLKSARGECRRYEGLLTEFARECDSGQDATSDLEDVESRLRVRRARRVQTDLLAIALPSPAGEAPEWQVRYRSNGTFRAQRLAPLPAGDLGDQLSRAWGYAPTPDAAQHAVARMLGNNEHRVTLRSPRVYGDVEIRETGPNLLSSGDPVWHILEEDDDEPAYQAFLADCERLRFGLAQIEDLSVWVANRIKKLETVHPRCSPYMLRITPSLSPNSDHSFTHVEAIMWVPTDLIVTTSLDSWGELSDHKPWRPIDLAHELIEAVDDGRTEGFARRLFMYDPMKLTRINAWAGPVYMVGEEGDGRHRAHTLRILGLPWAAAHVTHPILEPCLDLYGLVADDNEHEQATRAPVERVRERAVLIDGLRDRGIIDAWWDADHEGEWLWCRHIPAPWLLRNAREATAANRVYEATYPGALARLGIPTQVGCDARAWTEWLTRPRSHHQGPKRSR